MRPISAWERLYNKRKRHHYKALIEGASKLTSTTNKTVTKRGQRPLRIAMFTDTYPPDINGVSVSVASLVSALEAAGHKVYVVTTSELTTFYGTDISNRIIRIPAIRLKKLYGYGMSSPLSYAAILYLKRMKVDIVHIHTDFSIRILGEICAKMLKLPVIYTYHTMYIDYTNYVSKYTGGHFDSLMKRFVVWFSKTSNKHCAHIIAPSEKTRDALRKYGLNADISVIPTGIEIDRFKKPCAEKTSSLKNTFKLDNKFCVLYLGRIAKEKSIEMLVDAIKAAHSEHNDIVLVIAGYGPYETDLREYVKSEHAEDCAIFMGKAARPDVPAYYHAGDIFVSASLSETQGLTYIEALASGLPLIARFDDCIKDLVTTQGEHKNGDFFDNATELAEIIVKYRNMSKADYEKICNNASLSTEKYSMKTFGEEVKNVYETALIERN